MSTSHRQPALYKVLDNLEGLLLFLNRVELENYYKPNSNELFQYALKWGIYGGER